MQSLAPLMQAISAVCPISGISVGSYEDKSTWVVHYAENVSEADKAAAQAVIAAFDPSAPTMDDYAVAVQAHIDAMAKARGYGDGYALASYASSKVAQWASEASTFADWRDQVWLYAYQELAKAQSGARSAPKVDAFVAELPTLTWPKA